MISKRKTTKTPWIVKNSSYLVLKTESSFCPVCNKPVYLLCSSKKKPSFYICFDCKFIGEVGKGKVLMEVTK